MVSIKLLIKFLRYTNNIINYIILKSKSVQKMYSINLYFVIYVCLKNKPYIFS